ncbi:MAG: DUF937 domain-containing protein [Caldilineaceae bacterium]|nr:DUF937 domain-containing protein [Caldilineaceae bacterium]MCB0126299.1 DUF937 domain-containing protein [Caldilineaceae bacterium]
MNDLMGILSEQVGGQVARQISRQLGTDVATTESAIHAALPMLLGAISRNAATPEGAASLNKALDRHDGSILNDLLGAVNSQDRAADGAKILGHVFGSRQDNVQQGLSQLSGLSAENSAQLLAILAPVVMGALGQTKRTSGLDADSLAILLGGQRERIDNSLGGFARFLDFDGDGSAVDDVIDMGSKMLGGLFGKKS